MCLKNILKVILGFTVLIGLVSSVNAKEGKEDIYIGIDCETGKKIKLECDHGLEVLDKIRFSKMSNGAFPLRKSSDLAKEISTELKQEQKLLKSCKSLSLIGKFKKLTDKHNDESKIVSSRVYKTIADFSLDGIPTKKTKHEFFNFSKANIITTEDYDIYKKNIKWKPIGKIMATAIGEDGFNFYDESLNFEYSLDGKLNKKTNKFDVDYFVVTRFPTTPYIFFAGYMGYPDIPEASPDYK